MGERSWTILEILRWTSGFFESKHVTQPRASAEVLLAHALGMDRIALYLNYDKPLTPDERGRYRALVKKRAAGEPTQYLTGRQEFWSLPFKVNRDVLIPRPETEGLVEEALKRIREISAPRVLDLGTGCGAIIAAVAKEREEGTFVASDRSRAAVCLARENAVALGLGERICFVAADLFDSFKIGARFDLIVSNPPYVSLKEYEDLAVEIREYEPPKALLAGKEGLDVIETILRRAPEYLAADGWLVMEMGSPQKERVLELTQGTGKYRNVSVQDDYARKPRVLSAQMR